MDINMNTDLPYESYNPTAPQTILFIHGGFSNKSEWALVHAHLPPQTYHLLIPDLPSHGEAYHIAPFTLDSSTDRLAALITTKAHNSIAHVVGLSIGAHVAAHLASKHPHLVASLLVSGFNLFRPSFATATRALLAPVLCTLQNTVGVVQTPGSFWERVRSGGGTGFAVTRDILEILISGRELGVIQRRTLVVAAEGRGWLMGDGFGHAKRLFGTVSLREGEGSRVVKAKGMNHAWSVENPGEFAEMVRCWVEGESLVGDFEDL